MTKDLKNDMIESNIVKPPKKKKKPRSLEKRRSRAGWFFVLPFIIGLVVVYLPLIFDSIYYSFSTKITVRGVSTFTFCGFQNYSDALFGSQDFLQVLVDGMLQLLMQIPAILMFSLFMAVILNQKMVGRAAFRAILFIPVILSTGIMELLSVDESMNAMNEHMGSGESIDDGSGADAASQIVNSLDIQQLLSGMKIGSELVDFVVSMINNIYDIVNRSGVQILIFLAGLQSISPAIYESCQIDGASGWETFWKITFPMISPMILVNGIYTVIDSFTSQSNIVMSYINEIYLYGAEGIKSPETYASAMSWVYFLIVVAIIAIVFALFSAFVFYQRRD